ncbi:hypothetical protein [Beggiatoa leptomitoformis]|uniref:Uncharacterized protein n=1 Tax=Beggiatoa leptomitoformis TaxID=288004 RepID=A0A2N9YCV6_9GAMM|nr:hypothetical protein [Beggiatoa leptomitoformis]ALG66433.1 hypothetical protein AL038_00105 [Beggiatoa leptomitoformis]AUI68290.1 hypothetical protein BLE401_05970 [Beggiatoa leptomitoformis]
MRTARASKIPANRMNEITEYLRLVPTEKAEEVLNLIAEHLGRERQREPVQLTLIQNGEAIPAEPTGQLSLVENVQIVKLETELKENRAELETVEAKAEELGTELETCKRSLEIAEAKISGLKTVLATFKMQAHPTSPRWQHARLLLAELENLFLIAV